MLVVVNSTRQYGGLVAKWSAPSHFQLIILPINICDNKYVSFFRGTILTFTINIHKITYINSIR